MLYVKLLFVIAGMKGKMLNEELIRCEYVKFVEADCITRVSRDCPWCELGETVSFTEKLRLLPAEDTCTL